MLVDLSPAAVVVLNILTWGLVQLGMGWVFTRMPDDWFDAEETWARPFPWERRGRVYERWFGIRRWKDHLPDAAAWFEGGYAKARLDSTAPDHLQRFKRETWRGELAHWATFIALPVLCLWNPGWAMGVNVAYAIASNLPCILVQRYNRARIGHVMARARSIGAGGGTCRCRLVTS